MTTNREQDIQRLRTEIAARQAEREGLDVLRGYLEKERARIARKIDRVAAEWREAEEKIHRLREQLQRVETAPNRRPASGASADLVCELLAEAGKPLHFRDIYRRLKSRETRPPRTRGGDPATAYLARYSSDPRLERTGRGTYRLKGTAPPPPPVPVRRPRSSRTGQERASGGYTGKQAVAYTLWGRRHAVKSFKEVLLGVCGAVFERSPADFEKALTLRGRKRPCFSRNPADLLTPAIVRGSDIYAESKLSAGDIVRRCGQVLRVCGHDPGAFSVDAR